MIILKDLNRNKMLENRVLSQRIQKFNVKHRVLYIFLRALQLLRIAVAKFLLVALVLLIAKNFGVWVHRQVAWLDIVIVGVVIVIALDAIVLIFVVNILRNLLGVLLLFI